MIAVNLETQGTRTSTIMLLTWVITEYSGINTGWVNGCNFLCISIEELAISLNSIALYQYGENISDDNFYEFSVEIIQISVSRIPIIYYTMVSWFE